MRILHSGTTASVAMNGWHTDAYPVSSGVFQGSPLSPLLFFFFFFFFFKDKVHTVQGHPGGRMRPNLSTYNTG